MKPPRLYLWPTRLDESATARTPRAKASSLIGTIEMELDGHEARGRVDLVPCLDAVMCAGADATAAALAEVREDERLGPFLHFDALRSWRLQGACHRQQTQIAGRASWATQALRGRGSIHRKPCCRPPPALAGIGYCTPMRIEEGNGAWAA